MMLYDDPQLMDFCHLARAIMGVIAPLQLVCQRLQSLVDEHSLDLEQALNSEECRALSIKSDGPPRWSLRKSKVNGHDACLCCTVYSNNYIPHFFISRGRRFCFSPAEILNFAIFIFAPAVFEILPRGIVYSAILYFAGALFFLLAKLFLRKLKILL